MNTLDPRIARRRLRFEALTDPLAIIYPRLSWIVESDARDQRQIAYAYEIVASSPELLAQGRGDLWASGKVVSHDNDHS